MSASDEAIARAHVAAEAADDVKATDLVVIEVADVLAIAEVFLVATATSDRQLKAVVDRIEERLAADGSKPLRREGTPAGGWVLLDYGDLVCQLFTTEERDTYGLERLWADVPQHDALTREALAAGLPAGRRAVTSAEPPAGQDPRR